MTDLERTRDHARRMATADHTPVCIATVPGPWSTSREVSPDPQCPGCITDAERALWTQIADEIDTYLAPTHDEQELPL